MPHSRAWHRRKIWVESHLHHWGCKIVNGVVSLRNSVNAVISIISCSSNSAAEVEFSRSAAKLTASESTLADVASMTSATWTNLDLRQLQRLRPIWRFESFGHFKQIRRLRPLRPTWSFDGFGFEGRRQGAHCQTLMELRWLLPLRPIWRRHRPSKAEQIFDRPFQIWDFLHFSYGCISECANGSHIPLFPRNEKSI